MKISVCIPQYNRSEILVQNLLRIEKQTYADLEIIISDDGSTDDTVARIHEIQKTYKYPIRLHVNEKNEGFDRNYRRSVELATGEYCFMIGNDDTIIGENSIQLLVDFLETNGYPDIGYCNYREDGDDEIVQRALASKVHGSGISVAIEHVNGFSFIGGLIYKRASFMEYNTGKHDGSIYTQMYLGLLMIASGCTLFTLRECMVLKDLLHQDGTKSWSSFRDGLPKSWSEFKVIHSGLRSVMNVLISACRDAQTGNQAYIYKIMRRMYKVTYPYWLVQYKHFGSLAASAGLMVEMKPWNNEFFSLLSMGEKIRIINVYLISTIGGFLVPFSVFTKLESRLRLSARNAKP